MKPEDLDREFMWHPFTPMREWLGEPPLVIERADGNELIDTDGRHYLDGVSSLWVNVHGHRHPRINAAIVAQLDRVAHTTLLGLGSTPSILLAERLVSLAPAGLRRVFFSDSGSTAVEVALKMAFQFQQLGGHTRRTKFLALDNAYHGDTIGSVSLGGIDTFHRIFHPLLFHTLRVPPEADALERALAKHADELCALVLEPLVQGAAGIRLMPPGLLRVASTQCAKHGVLLIADEVATGFGRTGTMFACEQEGVTPDLMAVAKGLSGGYLPVAATLCTDEIFSRFLGTPAQRLTFFHGHSFGGNPLACAAALASLQVFSDERTLESLPAKMAALRVGLAERIAPLSHVFEIRHKGLMIGVELRRDRMTEYDADQAIGARVCSAARKRGVILRPLGPVVVLMPPLSITLPQIDRLIDATAEAIAEATCRPGPAAVPVPASAPNPRASAPGRHRRPAGLFIAGTDTGVGKTAVARALLCLARRRARRPLPFKPVETGCTDGPIDARALRAAAGRDDLSMDLVCPFAFAAPVAPALAAEQSSVTLTINALVSAARRLFDHGDFLVVEAAGGLLSPYAADLTGADLAAALALPVLLVARNALGTINHTALALAELRRRALPLAGIILVDTTATLAPDRLHNARLITQLTGVRPLATLPFVASSDADALADALASVLDTDALFARAAVD